VAGAVAEAVAAAVAVVAIVPVVVALVSVALAALPLLLLPPVSFALPLGAFVALEKYSLASTRHTWNSRAMVALCK